MTVEAPEARCALWRRIRPRAVLVISVVAVIGIMLALWAPNGATYEEYLRLSEGMPRDEVAGIIGEADYWYHYEGENQVTSWVNDDGTYIRAVFDKNGRLIEVSWESGWDREKEGDWEWE